MAEPDLKRVKEVYTGALEQPSEQRQAYVEKACRGDRQLRDKVERMLAAGDGAADFMTGEGKIGVAETLDVSSTTQSHPESIGHYKILHTIGEGGMGIVYLAEQTEPVRRRVALKLVKLGMDTKQVIARFEAERQALAMMDHPNVAQVFEAGATETGRPYFAMEYVPGVPITKFCDTFCLTVPERLELFMQVCAAIQHAHQKGIIHRDLKPTNVLVMRQNGKPIPKVIDFGVAKATQQRLTEQTLYTEQGQMIGTPAYMSPEQAEMSPLGVDSRTDVYSLGVLLYELLVSMLPFEPAELRRAGYAEIQRIIREVEPPKPSTRFNSLGDESGSICDQRRLDTKSMRRLLQGDLDWITMKAIDKDPDRRYASASELAADVGRYLKDEPVVASPPGGAYRLRKFVRRNRTAVIAAAVVLVVLLGGIAGTSLGLIRARTAEFQQSRARQEAEQARDAEVVQRQIAEAAEREQSRARQEADTARDEAEKQKQRAEKATEQAREQSYLASIRGAQASIQANDVRNARVLLDQAPSEFRRWEWKYLYAQLDQSLAVLRGHDRWVSSVAFSPDGSRIASGGNKTVRVWDAASGQQLAVLRGHEDEVYSVAFSPDGSRIASGSYDKTVRLCEAASGQQLVVLRGHEQMVWSVAFSPDGSRIASGSSDNTVRLWDAANGEQLAVLRGHESRVTSVTFSPDGSRIASGSRDKTVRLWDASTEDELLVLQGHESAVWSVAFSPDGSRIASGSRDKTVRLWDASTGDELLVLGGHQDYVHSVAFSPDGSRIVSASGGKTVRLWDAASGEELVVLRGHESRVTSVAFSPEGSRIASGSSDGTLRLWDAAKDEELLVLRGHEGQVYSAAFSPDGSRIVSGGGDAMRLWDATSKQELAVLRGHEGGVESVAFSPDGSRIASGSGRCYEALKDNTVRLWDAATGEQLLVLRGHEDYVNSVTFSPDGSRIASGSWDNTVRLWDALTGEELLVLHGHERAVTSVAFSRDGSRIASASWDSTVRLWDASSGEDLLVLRGQEHAVASVAF